MSQIILKSQIPYNTACYDFSKQHEYMQYLYLPVKLPGQYFLNLEPRLEFLEELIWDAIRFEQMETGSVLAHYIYLTVKKTIVPRGLDHNRPGFHADGFGTDDVNYVYSDCLPTVFLIGNIPVEDDEHQSMLDMESFYQSGRGEIYTPQVNTLVRLDKNHVHATQPAKENLVRMFVKVTFSKQIYAQEGNSINHSLNLNWDYAKRKAQRNQPQDK